MIQQLTWIVAGVLFASSVSIAAEDAALVEIRSLLAPIRAKPLDRPGARGADPVFTEVKHNLRDWIESRLREFRDENDVRMLAIELNAETRSAKLSCVWSAVPHENECPDRGQPGYLGDIKLHLGQTLVVTTAIGIVCGFDESAYAYSFSNGRWKRFWQSETNNYAEGKYVPLNFLGILVSPQDYLDKAADPNLRLLLVLARDPAYCEANWYNVYYRVFALRIDRPEQTLLLDRGEEAFLGSWVDGIVSLRDVLIEYSTRMAFTDFLVRRVIRHYVLKGGKLQRDDPLAVSPRDFADEWMRTDWPVSSHWTNTGVNHSSLQRMHTKENFEGGQYTPTIRCESRAEHWQVGLAWRKFDGKTIVDARRLYFLVRWLPPYRFSMVGVSDHPWTGCTERDPAADEDQTLFPVHLQERW